MRKHPDTPTATLNQPDRTGSFARAALLALAAVLQPALAHTPTTEARPRMELGNFSISLAVKDLQASKAFYEKLDFRQVGGEVEQRWVILQNGNVKIGLFQGMFPSNLITFNPGWTAEGKPLAEFQDVRDLQRLLKARGIKPAQEADESSTGPAHFVITDPDGNALLFDQHVPRPR